MVLFFSKKQKTKQKHVDGYYWLHPPEICETFCQCGHGGLAVRVKAL